MLRGSVRRGRLRVMEKSEHVRLKEYCAIFIVKKKSVILLKASVQSKKVECESRLSFKLLLMMFNLQDTYGRFYRCTVDQMFLKLNTHKLVTHAIL